MPPKGKIGNRSALLTMDIERRPKLIGVTEVGYFFFGGRGDKRGSKFIQDSWDSQSGLESPIRAITRYRVHQSPVHQKGWVGITKGGHQKRIKDRKPKRLINFVFLFPRVLVEYGNTPELDKRGFFIILEICFVQ